LQPFRLQEQLFKHYFVFVCFAKLSQKSVPRDSCSSFSYSDFLLWFLDDVGFKLKADVQDCYDKKTIKFGHELLKQQL
jgi:hypothetical protein